MALITGFGLFVVTVVTAIFVRIATEEAIAWSPSVVRRIMKLAVRRLPEKLRERFQEEWQSHINDVPGNIGKIVVALGFPVAAYNLALDDQWNDFHEWGSRLRAKL